MSSDLDSLTAAKVGFAALELSPEDEARLWKKFSLEWNYHSNRIEGNTLSYGETELLLVHGTVSGTHPVRDVEEMKAHDVAIRHLRELAADTRPLNEADVRGLNQILLKEPFRQEAVTPDGKATRIQILPGEYKQQPNNVRLPDGSTFEYTAPAEVAIHMDGFIEWLNLELKSDMHPLEIATRLHHRFVLIHPFGDGNGRTARLLTNFVLLRAGYPPIIIRTDDKEEYLASLRQADAGDLNPLADFFARNLAWSLEAATRAARGESMEDEEDLDKEIAIFKRNQNAARKKAVLAKADLLAVHSQVLAQVQRDYMRALDAFDDLFSDALWFVRTPESSWSGEDPIAGYMHHIGDDWVPGLKVALAKDFHQLNGHSPSAGSIRTELLCTFHESHMELVSLVDDQEVQAPILLTYGETLLPHLAETLVTDSKRVVFERIRALSDGKPD